MKKQTKIVLFIILLLLFLDQLTKVLVKTNMSIGESFMIFGDWFQIRFIENKGAAYGFEFGGDFGKLFLSVLRIILIGGLIYYISKLLKQKQKLGYIIGFILILSGAVGNMIDSVLYGVIFSESTPWQVASFVPLGEGYQTWLHGSVVDMLYFPIFTTTFPEWMPVVAGDEYTFFSPIFNVADSYITIGAFYLLLFYRKQMTQ